MHFPGKSLGMIVAVLCLMAASASAQSSCANIVTRQEIRQLSDGQRTAYFNAIKQLQSGSKPTRYDQIVNIHYGARDTAHGYAWFLSWHRAYIREYELALQRVDSSIVLPYWDWSFDSQAPHESPIFGENWLGGNGGSNGCVSNGQFSSWQPYYPEPHCLRRSWDNGNALSAFYPPEALTSIIRSARTYNDFREQLEAVPHGSVHNAIGSDMSSMYSPNDPIFFLHHGFIDKLWSDWQAADPSHATDYGGPNNGGSQARVEDVLAPWQYKVSDILKTESLCYRYGSTPSGAGTTTPPINVNTTTPPSDITTGAGTGAGNDTTGNTTTDTNTTTTPSTGSNDTTTTSTNGTTSTGSNSTTTNGTTSTGNGTSTNGTTSTGNGTSTNGTTSTGTTTPSTGGSGTAGNGTAGNGTSDVIATPTITPAANDSAAPIISQPPNTTIIIPPSVPVTPSANDKTELVAVRLCKPIPNTWFSLNHINPEKARTTEKGLRAVAEQVNRNPDYVSPCALVKREDLLSKTVEKNPTAKYTITNGRRRKQVDLTQSKTPTSSADFSNTISVLLRQVSTSVAKTSKKAESDLRLDYRDTSKYQKYFHQNTARFSSFVKQSSSKYSK